ncbi:MAG: maleate cis-trans isomerase family protein, partial [Hyphomicrobiales bacterium]
YEWQRLLGLPGVSVYGARILNSNQITPETLRAMEPRISKTADLILPGAELDVLAYGCTSATMTLGEEVVFERLKAARPNARFTTPITGAFAAFEALGARRIGVLTPYRADVNQIVADYISGRGFEVPVFGSFNEERDDLVARIDATSLKSGIEHICALAEVDAVFVSCTSVRLADHVVEIEQAIGLPVTSSNHAMAWHALRLGGVDDKLPEFGRLFAL